MTRLLRFASVLLILLFPASPLAAQVTRVVDDDAQGTAADCNAAAPAYSTVSAAIAAAADGDTIVVCPGTYVENIAFAGKAITVRSAAGPAVTVLDGGSAGSVVTFASGEGPGSVLEGFTIQNGRGNNDGGGIRISYASPVVRRNAVVDNVGCSGGAGISVLFASPLIEENTIARNRQLGCSGGTGGGGILLQGEGSPIIRRNVITYNSFGSDGGGVSLWAAGTPVIESNIISHNSASDGGGISLVNRANATIAGNVIVRNSARDGGGGVSWLVPSGETGPVLAGNTIAENQATFGSGVLADGFDVAVVLVNNVITAPSGQAAVFCGDFNDLHVPTFRSNNISSYGGLCTSQTGLNGNITADPLFADPAADDFHLLPGSPSIDAGDNAAPGLNATDIDNHQRVLDGDGDSVARVDMGADEAPVVPAGSEPGAFTRAAPADAAQGQGAVLSLSWGASSGATTYEYCYDTTDNGRCDGTWLPTWGSTAATLSGLASETTYYWHVRARNASGTTYADGSSSPYWSFTTRLQEPKAFAKSNPYNGAQYQSTPVTLSWGASALAASYEYCYDTVNNNACDSNWVSAGNATSVQITGLNGYTMYFWQVRAVNASGVTYADNSGTAFWRFTTGMPAPSAFGKTSPAAGAQVVTTTVLLSWEASAGAESYQYCVDTSNNGTCDGGWGWTTSTSATAWVNSGRTYYWQVRASNSGGATDANGSSAAFWSFTTWTDPLGPFAKNGPANGAQAQPTTLPLTWTWSSAATSYEYCYDTVNNNACDSTWKSTTSTVVTLSGLRPGTTYYWQVRSRNAGGTLDADTSWWSFSTYKPVPILDFDGDGRPDLVWRHHATGTNAIWLMNNATVRESRALPPVPDTNWQICAMADFNADAKPDLVWRNDATGQNVVWYLDGTRFVSQAMLPAVPDVRWRIVAAGDFDGNSKPDLVWRNDTTGQNVIWFLDGVTFLSQTVLPAVPDTRWEIVAAIDFNGDGQPDLAWRNDTTGQNVVWYMSGRTFGSQALLPAREDTAWHVGLVADIDGNGRADIVWRNDVTGENDVWYLEGVDMLGQAVLASVSDTAWHVARPGKRPPAIQSDFDGDGQADLLWRNVATGQSAVWLMNGVAPAGVHALLPTVSDVSWQVAAVADFTGDGRPDILWRNGTTGQNVVWQMNGLAFVSQTLLPAVPNTQWGIVAAAEMNGDANTDIIWRNRATGQNVVWFMSGTTFLAQSLLPPLADVNWVLAGAADLNNDRHPDLVWRNAATGESIAWYMKGTNSVGMGVVLAAPGGDWHLAVLADFDGDRQSDIVWRNYATGQNVVRYLRGPHAATETVLPPVSDTRWVIVRDPR